MSSVAIEDVTDIRERSAFASIFANQAFWVTVAVVMICLATAYEQPDTFATKANLFNVTRNFAAIGNMAMGMTMVIITGGIDLSVGSNLALVNALAAIALAAGIPWPAVVLMMLLLGALIGIIQGYFVAYEGIPAFIVTLAGLSTIRGVALLITEGYSVPISGDSWFVQIGRGWLFGIPLPAIIGLIVAILGYVTLTQTRYGRYVTGIGANVEAVRRAGVNVRRTILTVYMLTGIAAAIAGLVIAARLGSGSSNAGVGFELEVIAAVVLGGTNLFGGRGTIIGTALGALTIAVIGNGLILAHISPFFTQIVTGLIILLAIWLNTRLFDQASRLRRVV